MKKLILIIGSTLLLLLSNAVYADSTKISLSFEQGKIKLLKESLQVLSEYYQINQAEIELLAVKTWSNPTLVWNADMYQVESNKYFQMNQQNLFQIDYVFGISGTRIRAIKQANLGIEIAKYAFLDVLRGLIMEYSEAYVQLYLLKEKNKVYTLILDKYSNLINSYSKQLELGVISFNQLVRLKSEFISINAESISNENEIVEEQKKLNQLLNFKSETIINVEDPFFIVKDTLSIDIIREKAKLQRPDYLIAQKNITYYQQSLKVEQSKAFPQAKLGYQPRDKGSNYMRPYAGMVFEINIPIFDRNQAGIERAKVEIEKSKTDLQIFENGIENEVTSAYFQYVNNKINLANYTDEFITELDELSKNALINFQKKNITLLEFLDYQQIYIETRMKYLETKCSYLNSLNFLSFTLGKELRTN
jgi:cobalt-zinc-cadmium efflux system outer membrane protein